MVTLGNDIVDLNQATDKTQDSRFLNRVFSKKEQAAISHATSPHQFLWVLWALKEAAFKAYQKQHLSYIFSPIECQVVVDEITARNVGLARVQVENCLLKSQYQINQLQPQHYIESVAWLGDKNDFTLIHDVRKIQADDYICQSQSVRELARDLLLVHGLSDYMIERPKLSLYDYEKQGPPQLVNNAGKIGPQISLSHDGVFVAVAISI